jgi:hypothetical protein
VHEVLGDVGSWEDREPVVRESPSNSSTPRQRFNHINAMHQSIASLAGWSVRSYEMAVEAYSARSPIPPNGLISTGCLQR